MEERKPDDAVCGLDAHLTKCRWATTTVPLKVQI